MSKRKILILALSLCMVAILAVGGTLAYFTDDEQAHNVMTIGNVEINIDEFQKNKDGEWEPFKDEEFHLYPVDWSVGTTYRNKVAYTANVSTSGDDAYIRTIVLIEKNDLLPAEGYADQDDCCVPGIHFNYFADAEATSVANQKTIHGAKVTNLNQVVEIGNEKYHVILFEEVSGLAVPCDEALFSLNGVFMDKNITADLAKGWGDKVDIIVYSQAIQATGLTYDQAMEALGEINETNLKTWIKAEDAVINNWN